MQSDRLAFPGGQMNAIKSSQCSHRELHSIWNYAWRTQVDLCNLV